MGNNAYKSQGTSNSGESGNIVSKGELNNFTGYEDNILDDYTNITYYFHIYMLKEFDYLKWNRSSKNKKDLLKYDKYTLFRTSDTDHISLDKVVINSLINSNGLTHNITDTTIRVEMKEPMGFSFIDDIYQNTYRLGYPSHVNIPIFIDFHLVGYDKNSTPMIIPNTSKTLVTVITNFTPKLDVSGTNYTMELISINQVGIDNEVFNIPNAITLDQGIINVNAFFTQLQEKLNKLYQDANPKFVEIICPEPYQFDVAPELKNEPINQNTLKSSGDNDGSSTWEFPTNTSIQTICDKLLVALENYKLDISISGDSKTKIEDKWSIKVIPEVIYMGKCNINNQLVYKYIYHIKKFKNLGLITNPTKSNESTADFNYLKRNGLLKKRYDYIYTGVNDYVLDVNLNIDHLWFAKSYENAADKAKGDTTSQQYIDGDTLWTYSKDVGDYVPSTVNPNNYPANAIVVTNDSYKTVNGLRGTIKEDAKYMADTNNTGDKIEGQDIKNSAIYDQIYNATGLQELNMTIKGDPYWYNMDLDSSEAVCNKGQVAFLFHAKTPKRSSDTDQLDSFKDSVTLNGVYLVNQVENIFEGGIFTQKLSAIQDLNIKFTCTYNP